MNRHSPPAIRACEYQQECLVRLLRWWNWISCFFGPDSETRFRDSGGEACRVAHHVISTGQRELEMPHVLIPRHCYVIK